MVGASVVDTTVVGATVVDAMVDGTTVVGATPLGTTVVVAMRDCVVWVAAVVVTGRASSTVVEVASREIPADAGRVVCTGAPSFLEPLLHALTTISKIGASRSNRRLTTGLGHANARLVP
ncbi:MAG: hypothetical protein ACO3EQ_01035 [Ilumatobacteraceae bacterium]